ncbi:DUF4376 domain-containing protein [Pseudoalteromonas sp. NCIMB_1079]|uniref:DUF4376 domain-containing protein n=1 Tax=Pseudoalteromonas sp. NCIMB 1079 TaxID=3142847 RepID=UPI00339C76B0
MLRFIDEKDFLLVDKYKQNEDGSVGWSYNDGVSIHSGFLREGMSRDIQVQNGAEQVKVGEQLALDSEGYNKLDDDGLPLFEPVYEEQPKYETEIVDIWAKFQSMIAQGKVVVDNSHLVDELKLTAKGTINSTRDRLNNSDIEYGDHIFQADSISKGDIMGAVVTETDTLWLTRENEEVEMSAEDMKGLGIAIANRKKFLVYKARHFKDALDALSDEASIKDFINNLDWSA